MSDEHGWPDHHGDHGFEHHDEIGLPGDDPLPDLHDQLPDEHFFDDGHDGGDAPGEPPMAGHDAAGHDAAGHDDLPVSHAEELAGGGHDLGTVGADPDVVTEAADDPVSLFPPVVDVGPLPEPVDGFPWIDTGSLGLVDPAAVHPPAAVPDPRELAEYAAADLPPGVDPWAALAGSDDPATSALARWWSGQGQ